jgi:hypothetical protein
MDEDEPNLVNSGKSQHVVVDGYPFSIEIYRFETDKTWTLEVIDIEGTSHVWDEQFRSDKDARNTAIQAIEGEGAMAFMRGDNIIPFRKP